MATVIRLDPSRFDRALCVTRWPAAAADEGADDLVAELRDAGVTVLKLERTGARALGAWRPLGAWMRGHPVDVLHAHMFGSNVWGTVISRVAGVPVMIAHEHMWSFEGEPVRRLLEKVLIGRGADAFLAVSRELRRRMIELEGISPEKVLMLPNGIPAPPPAAGRDVRAELGIPPGVPVIGAVGRLRPEKAMDVLVRAAKILLPDHEGLRVLIAGDGEERAGLERLVADLGLGDSVYLLGRRADVPDLLTSLDVAVNCSDFEGSPLAVMEFMEAGTPIVATAVGGTPDLVEHGVHGLLVEPRRPDQLARAVAQLLGDPEAALVLARRAQARRRAEFTIETMVQRLERLYVEMDEEKRSRGRRRLPLASVSRFQQYLEG